MLKSFAIVCLVATQVLSGMLWEAAKAGDVATVKENLEGDIPIDAKDSQGFTPLMWAATYGHDKIVELLLEHGANVNEFDRHYFTPLIRAAYGGHVKAAALLLKHGANVQKKDGNGNTALMWAAKNGHDKVVELLLLYGATAGGWNASDGLTALILASNSGHKKVIKLLLDNGSKINEIGKDGRTALIWAAREGNAEMAEFLLNHGASLNQKEADGYSALFWAAFKGHDNVLNLLILYANQETLIDLVMYALNKDMQDFIRWLQDGALLLDLKSGDAARFAPIAFAMPNFVHEFEILFSLLGKKYAKLFTADVIKKALFMRNVKAFEIVVDKARRDQKNDLLNLINKEVKHVKPTKYNRKFLESVKSLLLGTKITGMKKTHDIGFTFQ